MGMLERGVWKDVGYDTKKTGGAFVRKEAAFRDRVEPANAEHAGRFVAQAGRYHLYVSLACPWAHRTLVVRALKGLEDAIGVTIVDPLMLENGWTFSSRGKCTPDPWGARFLYEVYLRADPQYTGRVTVPVLWDTVERTIVNNESSEILRILDTSFDAFATRELHGLYPEELRAEIDAVNQVVYDDVNNGVYKAGFATTQESYEKAVGPLFDRLDALEERLRRAASGSREGAFLVGGRLTEADIRLFTTLVRFDAVYHGHFKCNVRRIADYPALHDLMCRIHALGRVADTVDLEQIKLHYYGSHRHINPTGIVPVGPRDIFARV